MESALKSVVLAAAGSGGPSNPDSRYYGFAVRYFTRPDGVQVAYLERRIIPQPDIYTSLQNYVVVDGDRLDNLASKYLRDPLLFWMIADANAATDPEDLTSQIGRTIQIPLTSSIPAGARNA